MYNNRNTIIGKRFSAGLTVFFVILAALMMTSGLTTTTVKANAATSTLPTCTDPTSHNLPCMMVISTLPPPPNAVQCQESSGQILPCSYATQILSNGQEVAVITVYTPINYVFGGYGPWTVVKLIIHETKTKVVYEPCPKGQILDPKTHKCVDINYCPPPLGYHIDSITHKCIKDPTCEPGQVYNPITGKCEQQKCERPDSNAVTDLDKDLKTLNCDAADANEHLMIPVPPPSICKDNTTCPSSLSSASNNASIPSSGGSGTGSTCANNCTSGTPVDCTKNPTDPSCTRSLTPSITTPPSTSVPPPSQVLN
jgi:hypothetical protein